MPSPDDLLELFENMRGVYGTLISQFEEDEQYIQAPWNDLLGQGVVPERWADQSIEVTVPPTVYNAVENAADHILSVPRTTVPVRPTTENVEKERALAESKRLFCDMFHQRLFEDQGDPWGRGKKQLVKGKMVFKMEFRWDLAPELPEDATPAQRRKHRRDLQRLMASEFAWRVTVIPKETIFEDPSAPWNPGYVFEQYETRAMDVRSRFANSDAVRNALKDAGETDTVEYMEFWSAPWWDPAYPEGQFIQWVAGEVVHSDVNPYAYRNAVPYIIRDPGWGDVNAENKPEDRYVSIVRPIKKVAKAEARFLTEMEAYLRLYIWKILLTTNMPDIEDGEKEIYLGPGAHLDMTEDQKAEWMEPGEMPLSLLQGMERVNQYADEASRFGVLGGIPQRGVDTATEASQNSSNALTKLSGPIRALRSAAMVMNKWALMDVEEVGVPVTIYGALEGGPSEVTLNPSDIRGYYFTAVEMETSDDAALQIRNARVWSDLYQRLPVSAYTVLKNAGVPNPARELDERAMEDLERSPQMQQVALMMMLLGLGEVAQPILQAFQQGLAGNQQQRGGNQLGAGDSAPVNGVEEVRTTARNEAIENQPERALF